MSKQRISRPKPNQPQAVPPAGLGAGRDLNVGGDVAGGDVVKTTTTNVGLGAKEVQRLLLTVGALVFITAACFFSGGLAVGAVAVNTLNRPVNSNDPAAAARFAAYLEELRALSPGQPFAFGFTEQEISAYFRLTLAPSLGITNGKVRLLDDPGQLVVGGQLTQLGGLPFAATFHVTDTVGAPLSLTAAAVQILPLKDSLFGWVFVPVSAFGSITDNLNRLFANLQFNSVEAAAPAPAWIVNGLAH